MDCPTLNKIVKIDDTKGPNIRRRKKPVKSCSFCRQRKLKCDQSKPVCSSCRARGLATCVYSSQFQDSKINTSCNLVQDVENIPSKHLGNDANQSFITKEESSANIIPLSNNNIENSVSSNEGTTVEKIGSITDNHTTLALLRKINKLEQQVNSIVSNGNYDKGNSPNTFNNEDSVISRSNSCLKISDQLTKTTLSCTSAMSPKATTTNPVSSTLSNSIFVNDNLNEDNPLNSFCYMQKKESGRRIVFGATSSRTNLFKHRFGFGEKYIQLWHKVKVERNKWKKKHKRSRLRELTLVDTVYNKNYDSLLDQICDDLPSYEKCLQLIKSVFDPQFISLYFIACILDEKKVMKDFHNAFIPATEIVLPDGSRKVGKLVPGPKKNFYKIGVLLMLIICTSYYGSLPDSFELFFTNLCGQSSGKIYYIERLQFLLLRYQHQISYVPDADNAHVGTLTSLCVSTAIMMGLDRNIDELYKGQEEVVGSLESLNNIWYIVAFIDFQISFQTGKPLELAEIDLDFEDLDSIPMTHPHLSNLRKVTRLGRKIMKSLLAKKGIPKIRQLLLAVLNFFEKELPPLSYFIDETLILQINLYDVKIASTCMELVMCLNNLRFSILGELTSDYGLHYGLISLSMLNAITKRCYSLDERCFPEFFEIDTDRVPPYLSLSIFLTSGLVARASSIITAITYFNLTIFQAHEFLLIDHESGKLWDLSQLYIDEQKNDVNICGALKAYHSISESWLRSPKLEVRKILARSAYFVIANAMQMTFKKVLDNALEYRKKAEELWKSQLNALASNLITDGHEKIFNQTVDNKLQNINASKTNGLSFGALSDLNGTTQSSGGSVTPELSSDRTRAQFIRPHAMPLNERRNSGLTAEMRDGKAYKEMEMLQTIADDFWLSHNSSWEKFLDQTNPEDLFNTL